MSRPPRPRHRLAHPHHHHRRGRHPHRDGAGRGRGRTAPAARHRPRARRVDVGARLRRRDLPRACRGAARRRLRCRGQDPRPHGCRRPAPRPGRGGAGRRLRPPVPHRLRSGDGPREIRRRIEAGELLATDALADLVLASQPRRVRSRAGRRGPPVQRAAQGRHRPGPGHRRPARRAGRRLPGLRCRGRGRREVAHPGRWTSCGRCAPSASSWCPPPTPTTWAPSAPGTTWQPRPGWSGPDAGARRGGALGRTSGVPYGAHRRSVARRLQPHSEPLAPPANPFGRQRREVMLPRRAPGSRRDR